VPSEQHNAGDNLRLIESGWSKPTVPTATVLRPAGLPPVNAAVSQPSSAKEK
jgi:hypothetical protein